MKMATCILLLSTCIAGCVALPPVEMKTRFVGSEHDQYRQQGSGVIVGQGFLRQKGGGVVTCAGSEVFVFPATPFFQEIVGHMISGHRVAFEAMGKVDPAYRSIAKQTQCDAQGNFMFTQLPSGSWYVATEVKWFVGTRRQGGSLLTKVSLNDGQRGQLVLSNSDYVGW